MSRVLPPALLLLPACGGPASFSLRLEPVTAPDQADAFEDVVSLWLEVRSPGARAERYDLGTPDRGATSEVGDLPAIEPDSVVAVEGYDLAGDVPSRLVLYGVTGPLDLEPDATVVVPVYTAATERMAVFDERPEGTWGAAGASDGAGNFYLFGGSSRGPGRGGALDAVRRLALAPVARGFPLEAVATLPATADDWGEEGVSSITARSCASATRLGGSGHGDVGRILLAGGWADFLNGWSITAQALLFDPATGTLEPTGPLGTPRAGHMAVALETGEVVVFGGFTHTGDEDSAAFTSTVEVYRPADRAFTAGSDPLDIDVVWGSAASLGDAALWCGGLDWGPSTYGAWDACYRVDRAGAVTEVSGPDLGADTGLLRPAMAALGSGRVLLAGGTPISGRVALEVEQPATDRAWVYDATTDSWTEVASMHRARVFHAAAPLPGNRVLVVGGADASSSAGMTPGDPVPCAELYQPDLDSWTYVGACVSDGSTGVLPSGLADTTWIVDPEYGVLALGGLDGPRTASPHVVLFTPNPRTGE